MTFSLQIFHLRPFQIEDPSLLGECVKLESSIKYREGDLNNARVLVEQYQPDDPHAEVNLACIEYKEGNYDEALARFTKASNSLGYQVSPGVLYR